MVGLPVLPSCEHTRHGPVVELPGRLGVMDNLLIAKYSTHIIGFADVHLYHNILYQMSPGYHNEPLSRL